MANRDLLLRLICLILLSLQIRCAKLKEKLSDMDIGNKLQVSYDWTSDKVEKGLDYSIDKVSHFISEADELWLSNILDSAHGKKEESETHKDKSPAQLKIAFDGKMTWPVKYSKKIKLTSQFGT